MKLPKSKRLRFCIAVIIVNFILGIMGMLTGANLLMLGGFLSLSNTPLYVYVLGDSYRPSNLKDINQ